MATHTQTTSNIISNPSSTGGSGYNYENFVQASFVLSLLAESGVISSPNSVIEKILFQSESAGYSTDDCVLFLRNTASNLKHKFLLSIKKTISIAKSNEDFRESLLDAWKDFHQSTFKKTTDHIGLVTAHLTKTDNEDVKTILEWAKHCVSADEFAQKLVISKKKQEKYNIFQQIIVEGNENQSITQNEIWQFLKCYEIIVYSKDVEYPHIESTIRQLVDNHLPQDVWNNICAYTADNNRNAGTITQENIGENLQYHFKPLSTQRRDIWQRLNDHTDLILNGIHTDICGVKIERNIVNNLSELIEQEKFLLVTGKPGAGKSAVIKEYVNLCRNDYDVICLRAEDFNHPNLETMFQNFGITISLNQLSTGLSINPLLIFFIESLEKVLELDSQHAFNDFLILFDKKPTWKIIATCRNYAAEGVQQGFFLLQDRRYHTLEVPEFSNDNVQKLCEKCQNLTFYTNERIKDELLCNPFIAKLASQINTNADSFGAFKHAIWKQLIAKESDSRNGMPQKRRDAFTNISVLRARSQQFFVDAGQFDAVVLSALKSDGMLIYSRTKMAVAPAHDILEDWALEHFIESKYELHNNSIKEFFNTIGSERGILRGFRFWLSEKVLSDDGNLSNFICQSLVSNELPQIWKDEILTAILIGNTHRFLPYIENQLFAENGKLLARICLVLNSACRKYDNNTLNEKIQDTNDFIKFYPYLIKPFGSAWKAVIEFLLTHKDKFCGIVNWDTSVYLNVIQIFYQYAKNPVDSNDTVLLTKITEFALEELQSIIAIYQQVDLHSSEKNKQIENIVEIVVILCQYNQQKVTKFAEDQILSQDIENLDYNVGSVVKLFLQKSLMDMSCKHYFCDSLPELTAKLLLLSIITTPQKELYRMHEVSDEFGVYDEICNYYTNTMSFNGGSAFKGPFYRLLQIHTKIGLDLILELLNHSAKRYFESRLDDEADEKIIITITFNNGQNIEQYCSPRLYFAHREHLSPYAPGVIQTALMALEHFLFEILKQDNTDVRIIENIVSYILTKSNSVMPTAVLISLATGFHNKFLHASLPFLRVREFFELDVSRSVQEQNTPRLNFFGFFSHDPACQIYQQERQEAFEYPWRKQSLVGLAGLLQMSPCREDVCKIIDDYNTNLQDGDEIWANWLYRMDVRKAKIEVDKENNRILFIPTERPVAVEPEETRVAKEFLENSSRFLKMLRWAEQAIVDETVRLPEPFKTYQDVAMELQYLDELFKKSPEHFRIYIPFTLENSHVSYSAFSASPRATIFFLRAETQRARSFYFLTRKDGKHGMRGKRTLKNFSSFRPSALSALKKY